MKRKKIVSLLAIGAVVSAVVLSTNAVLADDSDNNHPLVTRIAEKFGLNEDEVEAVFDAVHEEHMTQKKGAKEDRLNQAVEAGVITEGQKTALMEKWQEMWTEKKQEYAQHREEMQSWYEEQGIDHDALMEYMGGFGKHGRFGKMGRKL